MTSNEADQLLHAVQILSGQLTTFKQEVKSQLETLVKQVDCLKDEVHGLRQQRAASSLSQTWQSDQPVPATAPRPVFSPLPAPPPSSYTCPPAASISEIYPRYRPPLSQPPVQNRQLSLSRAAVDDETDGGNAALLPWALEDIAVYTASKAGQKWYPSTLDFGF